MKQQYGKVIKNPYIYSILSKCVFVLTGFLFTVFQARFLGAAIKGQIAVVNSITGIAYIIMSLGIYEMYPYYKRTSEKDVAPIFLKITLYMFMLFGSIAVILVLCNDFSKTTNAALLLTPLLTYSTAICYFSLIENPNQRNRIDMIVSVIELLIVFALWLFVRPKFYLGVLVIAAKELMKAAVYTVMWRKSFFASDESIIKWIPQLVKLGFFPMVAMLMSTLNYRVDVLMLEGNATDAAIGIYSIGVSLAERVWMIPDAMKGVLTSNITKGKNEEEVSFAIRICNTACLFLIIGLIILGKPFIILFFGSEFAGAYQVTMILLVGVFAMIYYKLIAAYYISLGQQKINFIFLTVSVVCNIVMNYFMIPKYGIYGAGIASVVSYCVCAIAFILYFTKRSDESVSDMLIIKRSDIGKLKGIIKKK